MENKTNCTVEKAIGKTVVIAGAGDALGQALTDAFLKRGWDVFAGYPPDGPRRPQAERLTCFGFDPCDHAYTLAAKKKVGVPVDMLIVNIDRTFGDPEASISDPLDFDSLLAAYDYNCIGALRAVNAFLPLLEEGRGKRICVVTTARSSNNGCTGTTGYAERLSRAPLNMAMTQLFNGLRPEGYTFRLYCRDVEGGNDAWAADYFIRDRSYEPEDLKHSDEERIVLRDWMAREIPW
ncbi:MAG: hypothetical protein LBU58_10630 [Clostridiales bacterium]|jgi:NAD(P)-dependent dehydrogenase (short-subunit alcohol dehydrogenase family)|nr:hypothetical protein [Clostridiales bacterium]